MATWNFQLRPTFWFGLTLCDSESAPEFTKNCTPDSDANNLVGTDPTAPDYIGKHPGNAFMELQFYGPGYVPQFEGFGCAAHPVLRGDDDRQPHARPEHRSGSWRNNAACNNYILGGPEPINWAYITTSGVSQAPAEPVVHRDVLRPEPHRGEPRLHQGPDDEPRRPHPHPHARHGRPASGST